MAAEFNTVGPYKIDREIGRGGMAAVYLATDTRSGQQVALKVVPNHPYPEAQEKVRAEQLGAELQRQFSEVSAYVPRVYEHRLDDDYFYLAMEYLDGSNLSDVLRSGALHHERAVSIAADLCRFVEDADRFDPTLDGEKKHSVIHGDLTPRNIRLTAAGQVRILDFGIAKALSLTRKVTRNDFGTLAYLSPERLETNDVDRYADFWAIGVLLYEMIRGERPFSAPDTQKLERQIRERRPPPALDGHCPAGLQAIIAKLLAPSPADRYDTASAIAADLDRFKAGEPTVAEQQGWPARAEAATRRTKTPEDQPATRRTQAPAPPGAVAVPNRPVVRRRRRALYAALMLLGFMTFAHESCITSASDRAARLVPTQELDELPALWSQYQQLSDRSVLHMATGRLRNVLTERTSDLADRVIADYRASNPSVREAQWKLAREGLAHAIAASSDKRLRAEMRYCDGQLHRINGEALVARKDAAGARHEFANAVTAFRESAELRADWPDPFLGLARTFIYGLQDVDRGADALQQAERLGYVIGERETAQLGDGYRQRAELLARRARQLRGMPQERDQLVAAAESERQAIAQYVKAVGFGDALKNLKTAQRDLETMERRLAELSPSDLRQSDGVGPWG